MNELQALRELYTQVVRMGRTTPVDDDFGDVMGELHLAQARCRELLDTMPPEATGLTFDHLRDINSARCKEWHGDKPWSVADRVVEFIGEFGETCNVLKKLKRIEDGIPGNSAGEYNQLRAQLCDEFGDAQICLDLMANEAGILLGNATVLKFNKTSVKVGFDQKL